MLSDANFIQNGITKPPFPEATLVVVVNLILGAPPKFKVLHLLLSAVSVPLSPVATYWSDAILKTVKAPADAL